MAEKQLNPLDTDAMGRLQKAAEWSRQRLASFRNLRNRAIRQFVTPRWIGGKNRGNKRPVGLLELAIQVWMPLLMSGTPSFLVRTERRDLQNQARKFSLSLNKEVRRMGLEITAEMAVQDALFGLGIVKCGLEAYSMVELAGGQRALTQAFADIISIDDHVYDMAVKDRRKVTFACDRARVDTEMLLDSPWLKARDKDRIASDDNYGMDDEETAQSIGLDGSTTEDEYRKHTTLWNFWLPADRLIVTFPCKNGDNIRFDTKPIRIVEYKGADEGPYHYLDFMKVPDNTKPLPPITTMIDLDDLANDLFNKSADQGRRQKDVIVGQKGAEDDLLAIKKAIDGGYLGLDNPEAAKPIRTMGADPGTLQLTAAVISFFKQRHGNLDVVGGLAAQTDTVGQDRQLLQGANGRISGMKSRVNRFLDGLGRSIGHYLYTDPIAAPILEMGSPSGAVKINTVWTPEERKAEDLWKFEFETEFYSTNSRTPSERATSLMSMIERVVLPLWPIMQSQGIALDCETILRILGQYTDLPELTSVLVLPGGAEGGEGGGEAPGDMTQRLPNTTRTYERRSKGAGQNQGPEGALMMAAQKMNSNAA